MEKKQQIGNDEEKLVVRDELCEMVVLGGIASRRGAFSDVREFLDDDCFYNQDHREVFNAIKEISDRGDVADMVNIMAELSSKGSTIEPYRLVEILSKTNLYDIKTHAIRLRELAARRQLWVIGKNLVSAGTSELRELDEISQETKDSIDAVFSSKTCDVYSLSNVFGNLNEIIKRNLNSKGVITGTPTGFYRLDEKGGLQGSDLIIIAGETSQGKTSFALAITLNAIQHGSKIAFYSMEMTKEQLSARLVSMVSGVSSSSILYSSELESHQLLEIDRGIGHIHGDNLFFDDRSTSNIETILVSIRTMKIKHDIDGAVVDYLQILNVNMKNQNKEQAMGDIARRLKNLAKELNIFIIALSQLNRDKDNPEPNLNRLRDSGQIAEASDVVMFVYRPEFYGRSFPEPFKNASTENMAMIDVAKGRNIGVFKFLSRFEKSVTLFSDISDGNIPLETNRITEDNPF